MTQLISELHGLRMPNELVCVPEVVHTIAF